MRNPFSKFKQPSLAFPVGIIDESSGQPQAKGKSMNQLFRYLSLRWNIPRARITLRQPRQPFEMLRSYEDWSFDKVHSYNYPNEFRIVDLLPKDKSTVQLLY